MSKNPNYTGGERFNKLSKKDGYRSRAAYKLKQIHKTHNLIKQNQNILDIGCAPGSWIQVAKELTKGKAVITGIDILPMAKIEGITFLQKDLLEVNHDDLNDHFDLVLSDIAPNLSGIGITDSENMIELLNIEIYLINKYLVKGGSFLAKCFQGSSFDYLKEFMKENFKEVTRIKPEASRTSSKECYLLGKFKK
ncbi:MAG: RlmE family RNA methyltransferase [SAR86 cluster bacterium]|uniref:Ribosomal RNA large subunit methyltransferase E n=1 Tax=SAR86 cluster bacterium TaxID=2030880 RepID=A0A937I1P6_9GAMM|nr:RlmE family RNA methyltransferase [SAR86 cluster bacterium]